MTAPPTAPAAGDAELGVVLQFLRSLECFVLFQILNRDSCVSHRQFIELMDGIPATKIAFRSVRALANSDDIEQSLGQFKSQMWKIHQCDETATKEVMDKRFAAYIQDLSADDMDQLRLWYPGDSLKVEYMSPNERSFLPVEQGSPGQKTAALLSFILSYGDEPLILDQPEDDLDNQLIYDLIVSQLRTIKCNRQIIVVTHNANIVVNGDSENVLVLDARGGQTQVIAQGGLQDSLTREEICKIMEGGRNAFEQRYKRIISGL